MSVAALFVTAHAWAFEPFEVRDIRVEGLQRTEAGTVFGYLPIRVGDRVTEANAAEAVKALFATGFFKDVRLAAEGDVLVVTVEERPAIASIEISGSKEFEVEALKKALADTSLAEARIFDRALLDRAEQEIKRQYLSRSKYGVKITSTVTPLERNRVGIAMAIEEGGNARIAQIRIIGNRAFSEATLLDQLNLTTPTWLSWYTKTDQYSREKLAGDLETLRSFYLNRGYLEFAIESTQVSIDPDREGVYVTLTIDEGERFTVKDVSLGGNTLGREEQFRKLFRLEPGDTFSGERLTETTKAITDALGAIGYAFASATPVPQIDRVNREVSFTVNVDPGRRAYVRRITISGNQRTRDEVVRREIRQFEGAWFDSERIKLSRDRVERLGYFQNVTINTEPVPGTPDQVDLQVNVTERQTGSFMFGVGFSSTDKFLVSASINEPNFLGTGNTLAMDVNTGETQRTAALSFIQPYFTPDGVSRALDVYSRTFNSYNLGLGDYRLRSAGIGLRFGIPYTELDRLSFGVTYEQNKILPGSALLPQRYIDHIAEYGESSGAFLANLGWTRDSRDSALSPTRGRQQRLNLEVTFPGQDLQYAKATYLHHWYMPITKDYTFALSANIGYGRAIGDRPYPVFKNFYAGGINSVRGFGPNSLGPRDVNDNLPIGGLAHFAASAEFLFPLPGTGNDRTIRSFLFFDAGNVFDRTIALDDLRYSFGIGLNWLSPIGPLKLSVGYPLRKKPGDDLQRVQFQIGTGF
ncbi:MAG: outer membrane protein assembly factor BamA [Burkholderiaceae bacterium]|nr:outer membrane protein assembly factor BamA [Burkholderiaceae bacterium]